MSKENKSANQGGFCKTVCWLLGIAAGGYLAFALVTDFGVDQLQAAILGVVAMLLVGLILRRVFCRGNANRLRGRLNEAAQKSESEAEAIMAKASAVVAAQTAEVAFDANENDSALFETPDVARVDQTLTDIVSQPPVIEVEDEILPEPELEQEPEPEPEIEPEAVLAPSPVPIRVVVKKSDTGKPELAFDDDIPEVPVVDVLQLSESDAVSPILINDEVVLPETLEIEPDNYALNDEDETEIETTAAPVSNAEMTEDLNEKAKLAIAALKIQTTPILDDVIEDVAEIEVDAENTKDPAPQDETETIAVAAAEPIIVPEREPVVEALIQQEKFEPLEPKGMDGPENGTPDELERIEGVTEVQEAAFHQAGIYHFVQFAGMNRRNVAWLEENIPGGENQAAKWRKQAILFSREAT
ncbi:MAG: putative flap endonuclease-1-like 5' DNA nuclease [Paracoccaceae bacterium]|jgi:predicted flap endonuclease-1-like 5' DNA nuclease